jgi:hypothetical protein
MTFGGSHVLSYGVASKSRASLIPFAVPEFHGTKAPPPDHPDAVPCPRLPLSEYNCISLDTSHSSPAPKGTHPQHTGSSDCPARERAFLPGSRLQESRVLKTHQLLCGARVYCQVFEQEGIHIEVVDSGHVENIIRSDVYRIPESEIGHADSAGF